VTESSASVLTFWYSRHGFFGVILELERRNYIYGKSYLILNTLNYDTKTQSQGILYPTKGHKLCRKWAIQNFVYTNTTQPVRVQVIKTVLFKIQTFHSVNAASLGKQFPRIRRSICLHVQSQSKWPFWPWRHRHFFRKLGNYEFIYLWFIAPIYI